MVAAAEYSATTLAASFAILRPPPAKMRSIVGRMQERMSASFHWRINAMMNPEQKVAIACAVTDTLSEIPS